MQFGDLLKNTAIFDLKVPPKTTLFWDAGAGFSEAESTTLPTDPESPTFRYSFSMKDPISVSRLRWDPIEDQLCELVIQGISVVSPDAPKPIALNLDSVTTNGIKTANARWDFVTSDPMVLIPFAGRVSAVQIEGTWTPLRFTEIEQRYKLNPTRRAGALPPFRNAGRAALNWLQRMTSEHENQT